MARLTPEWQAKFQSFLAQRISHDRCHNQPNGVAARGGRVLCLGCQPESLFLFGPGVAPQPQHSRDPRVAVTMRVESMDWHEIKGLQFEGVAARDRRAPTNALGVATMMCEKFPFYESFTDVVAQPQDVPHHAQVDPLD